MADETQRRIIYLEVNATKAVDGSTAATRALASAEKGATSAAGAMAALEAASTSAGGAAQRTALNLAETAQSAANLNSAYRTTAGGALELARASTAAASSAQAQAAGYARLAEQKTLQASLAQTRTLMDSVARSTDQLAHMYGAATVAATTFANAQSQAAGYARLAEQNMIAASAAKTRATMSAVESLTPDQMKAFYFGAGAGSTPATPSAAAGRAPLSAQQRLMLGYQFNDIFTSLVGGMNPAMIAAQQGPQITQIFGGLRNTISAIPKPALMAGGAALGGLALGIGLKEISDVNEALEMQQRRLTGLFGPGEQAAAVYRDIGKMASGTATSIADATEAVVTFGRATRDLGGSGQSAAQIATMVEKLSQLSGASKQEGGTARSALVEMFKDSTVSAEQLRAVLGNVPQIADKIASGLGISVAQLKLMTQQGDVTNRQVFTALLTQTDAVNKEFEAMPKSLGFVLKSIGVEIAEMVTGLAAAVGQLTVIQSKADAIKAAQAANSNRPTRATPRVIGNPGMDFSDAAMEEDLAGAMSASVRLGAAVTASADAAVLAASKLAQGLDPAVAEVKLLQQNISDTDQALGKLQGNLTSFDAEKAAQETKRLTDNLQAMREKADAAGGAYYQALTAVQLREQQNELGMTPGQRAYAANVSNLAKPGSGVSIEEAQSVVDAQQLQGLDDLIEKQRLQVTIQTAMAQAMRGGKKAADDMSVSMAILGISTDQLNKVSPEAKAKLEQLAELMREFNKQMRLQATIDASKPLIDDLEGISAAMAVVEQGAYAMRRAEAAARAARDENGTGDLQMQVFDARQVLTDATMLHDLERSIDLTNALAGAAGNVAEQRRIQLEYDIKIAQLAAGPGAAAYIAEGMRADFAAKANREVSEGLADMERQVDLARQQLGIIRSGAPDWTAQLAMLQKRNELVAKGIDIDSDAATKQIELAGQKARIDEQISIARDAADSTKRVWQNAYDNIQTFGADTFYNIFSGAELNGQTVASSLKNIFLRAFAEIGAAAVIRPLISPLFQAAAGAGIGSSGALGAAAGTGSAGGLLGGLGSIGNLGGIGSIGSMANYGKQAWNWLGGLFGGGGAAASTAASAGGGSFANIGALLSSGQTGASAAATGASSGLLGAIPVWGWMAAAASIVKSFTGNAPKNQPLGIVDTLLGPSIDQWMSNPGRSAFTVLNPLGPLGMVLSDVLGLGIFGESTPKTQYSNTNANLRYGGNGWYTTGSAYGANANSGQGESSLRSTTTGIDSIFDLMGGVQDPSKVWGLNLSSWSAQGKDWNYTSQATHLVDPTNGNTTAWRMNMGDMMDTGAAQVAIRSILSGAVGEITESMKTALEAMRASGTGMKEVAENIAFVTDTYDRLGKAAISIKPQFEEVTKRFEDMADTAKTLGLILEPITAEQKKQTERLGQDYIDNLIDPVAAQLRAWEDEKASILANVDYIRQHTDVVVDQARIAEGLLQKEAALKEQLYGGAVSQLEDALARLGYGNLSNATTAGTLAGMRGTLDATVAQARANDSGAIGRLAGEITSFAEANRSAYGSSPEYEAVRQELMDLAREFQVQIAGPTPAVANNNQTAAQSADSNRMIAAVLNDNAELKQQVAELLAQVTRLVAKR